MSFLFVDRIVSMDLGKSIQGLKHVTGDDPYLMSDQHNHAVFAPSLIGETLGQLAAWNVMAFHDFKLRPVAGIVASTRLFRQVYPGETLLLESVIDDIDETAVRYHSTATVGGSLVFTIEGAIGPLLPMEQFIDSPTVRQQFSEIHRLGDWSQIVQYASHASSDTPLQQIGLEPQNLSSRVSEQTAFRFDHCQVLESGQYWVAKKLISRSAAYFRDHFPTNPVLPMTVLLQCKLNLAMQFLQQAGLQAHYTISELRRIKMNEFVHPGDVVFTHLKLKNQTERELVLSCLSEVNGKRVCIVEIVFSGADHALV